jgi:hypothetical protein
MAAGLKESEMPDRLFIISDMQFNHIGGVISTNFQEIEKKYAGSGYKRPNIVFWNVNGESTDFPVTVDDNGTCMISGASPSILKSIIRTKELNSISILREVIDDKRYEPVKKCII